MSVSELLDVFRGKYLATPELEIRFREVSFDAFKTLYSAQTGEPQFECAVYIIDEISKNEKDRREIYYKNGVVSEDKCVKKKRLHKNITVPNDYMKYDIGLSLELPINAVATKATNQVRFRTRASFPIEHNGLQWRLDLTAIKSGVLKNLEKILPTVRSKICGLDNTKASFINNLMNNITTFDSFEIEIEYVDEPSKLGESDLSVAAIILKTINPNYDQISSKQETIYKIASYLYTGNKLNKFASSGGNRDAGFRDLVPQVKILDKKAYNSIYPIEGYYLTEKTDGIRNLVMYADNVLSILNSNDLTKESIYGTTSKIVIFDAEFYGDTYHIFDVIYFEKSYADESFDVRSAQIDTVVSFMNEATINIHNKYKFAAKTYNLIDMKTIKETITARYNAKYESPIDGLIFVEPGKSYIETISYKWKPYEHNTIDFLAVRMPQSMTGVHPYIPEQGKVIYVLFTTILHFVREKIGLGLIAEYNKLIPQSDSGKYPVQFSPSINPLAYIYQSSDENLDGKIIELTRNEDNTDWVFVRHRDDRLGERNYYGNAFGTAERTFLNFYDRFDISYLWAPNKGYFSELTKRDDLQYYSNKCKRVIIASVFKKYITGSDRVIDLAIGRGADLPRYRTLGVKELLGIERDASAIGELTMRKYNVLERKGGDEPVSDCEEEYRRIQAIEYNKLIRRDNKSAMVIHTLIGDLTEDACVLSAKCGRYGFAPNTADSIVCNFAFHYMCDNAKNVNNLLKLVDKQLKVGGFFIMTTLNGAKVFDLLRNKSAWEYVENNETKYKFEKRYKSPELTNTGQQIATLLPMSRELMEEPLANLAYITKTAQKYHLELVESKSFGDFRETLSASNITEHLNDADWNYIGLYEAIIFKKVK